MHSKYGFLVLAVAVGAAGCATSLDDTAADSPARVNQLADLYYADTLRREPETAYFAGIELDRHDTITDNTLAARYAREVFEDALLRSLDAVKAGDLVGKPEWITHAYLREALEAARARRVCRNELWNISQMGGWHSAYAQLAQLQPVGTPALRQQSLARWSAFSNYVDNEIDNLKEGIEAGFSAPQVVVQRVVDQVDALRALEVEQSPFYSPASRDNDADFSARTRQIVAQKIYPALQRYRDYLAGEYFAQARAELAVTANPDGAACYNASLRAYTTLSRSAQEVYELGQKTVAANKAAVIELGNAAYGVDDFSAVLARAKADPDDRFASREELLAFSRDMVDRAQRVMGNWVGNMPRRPVEVVPFETHEEGTGRSAHYRPGSDQRPGEYRIPLANPTAQSRGNAEAVAFHETWPGHHLQVAVGQSVDGLHPITQIVWFSGPGEGWARYAEGLAEEMGLYTTTTGPIFRRAWPARGMVVDPGIHLFGWTREQAIEFMIVAGRFPAEQADDYVDRIAILPGQLTAYDSGGLEILALRHAAEAAMGDDFDIRVFHDRVLENGTIPLGPLRAHIEAWIAHYER